MNKFTIEIKESGCKIYGRKSDLNKVLNDMVDDNVGEVNFSVNDELFKENIKIERLVMELAMGKYNK